MVIEEKYLNELAKEICWKDGGGEDCKMDCDKCRVGHYKKWKWIAKCIVVKLKRDNKLKGEGL